MMLLDELLRLEETLLRLGPECDRARLESLLAADFVEFGASGRVWSRSEILEELAGAGERTLTLTEAVCRPLGADAALLTYRIPGQRESLRSSLWARRDGRWQMFFHQGTLVPANKTATSAPVS
jgi:hypothetical protein